MKRYVVYIHKDDEGNVKYVGMGKRERPNQTQKRSDTWNKYFKDRLFYPEIIFANLNEEEALEKEKKMYYLYKEQGYDLLNNYRGIGFGGNTYKNKSLKEMKEIRHKISEGTKGDKNGNKGQYIGPLNPMYGKKSPVRKTYVILNEKSSETILIHSRNELVNFLKSYRFDKYQDKGKVKGLSHTINNVNINEFCMGRLKRLDDFTLVNMKRRCDTK